MQLNSRLSEQEHNVHPVYRPDIDGLRAVAILSVVVFHAFPTHLRGGFVGVDIFFVISGFLISNIIFRSLQRGDFSFTEFYAHRIKRIFPALILVLATSFALGWFTLLPDEFKQLGKHMAAGAGFVQNFVLWKEAGYFDTASELKPLMHLWSLAIEEQFYLIYPLLIWAAWRVRLNALAVLIGLAALSFGLNVLEIRAEAVKTFFVPQTRYWELLAGAVLAYLQLFRRTQPAVGDDQDASSPVLIGQPASSAHRRRVRNNLQSACGLFLILVAVIAIHKGKAFPGWWALAPVTGAFLLILAGPQAWVNRNLLANRLMVFVGVISYPLYLWHWPILSFARIVEAEMPSPEIRGAAVALSFLLAWLTYRLLERPIR
ncbi:MAG: acyltransferase, partial [Betaproteobacteria bacterium]|nr:acyltransferase [Betaproteobacteria bacterium]